MRLLRFFLLWVLVRVVKFEYYDCDVCKCVGDDGVGFVLCVFYFGVDSYWIGYCVWIVGGDEYGLW